MIFISHKKEDSHIALNLSNYLKLLDVQTYVDELDPSINTVRYSLEITKHIINNLRRCSHLIVIFTHNTKNSMWVPFELGAAYEADKRIGTYKSKYYSDTLPDYLMTYPIMQDYYDIDKYVELYKREFRTKKYIYDSGDVILNEKRANVYDAESFINELKYKLGQ